MLKKFLLIIALSVGCTLLIAENALTLTIDFRDPYYSQADGSGSFESTKHGLTLTAMSYNLSTNPEPYLTWYPDDGFGVGGLSYEERFV